MGIFKQGIPHLLCTDSTTVLQWLYCVEKLSIFVANCVCERKELTNVEQWFDVNSGDNPVDTGTREYWQKFLKKVAGSVDQTSY